LDFIREVVGEGRREFIFAECCGKGRVFAGAEKFGHSRVESF
jgi:hypothetical protein